MGYVVGWAPVKMNEPTDTLRFKMGKLPFENTTSNAITAFFPLKRINEQDMDRPILLPYFPHPTHPHNVIVGACHRFGCQMPKGDRSRLLDFTSFYKKLIPLLWEPIQEDDVKTFKQWLETSPYSSGRRRALEKEYAELERLCEEVFGVKSFIKWEDYVALKNPRLINSYADASKTLLGALVQAMDKATFKSRFFVKGTNPRDWPAKLDELFGDRPVVGTDFSSFESHHQGMLAQVAYFWAMHMSRGLRGIRPLRDIIARMMLGKNVIKTKHVNIEVDQRLMSGAMWTSSANGVLNLMLMMYMASTTVNKNADVDARVAWARDHFVGLVEGDDGLCLDYGVDPALAAELGLKLEWKKAKDYSTAGFCSIYCVRGSNVVVKDPLRVMRKFFALPKAYLNAKSSTHDALLRARALSYLTCFDGSPVVASLCHSVLRATRSVDVTRVLDVLDERTATSVREALKSRPWSKKRTPVPMSARELVEQEFGVSVDKQVELEAIFDNNETGTYVCSLNEFVDVDLLRYGEDHLHRAGFETGPPEHRVHPRVRELLIAKPRVSTAAAKRRLRPTAIIPEV
jgi:hypothetical protein